MKMMMSSYIIQLTTLIYREMEVMPQCLNK
nr:MAG TPA: hypothetical protein [Caudoviricetes sp.]